MSVYNLLKPKQFKSVDLKTEDLQTIDDIPNVADKMTKLVSMIELSQEESEVRKNTCAELRELLRKYYPDCLLLAFGSTVNGFGLKCSDLDLLFLPFPEYSNVDFKLPEGAARPPIPDPVDFENVTLHKDLLDKLDEMSHLYFIRNILKRHKKFSHKLLIIPSKHCPTLKVNLLGSKIACDLAASNMLVLYNSELLHFYEKCDSRVRSLVITLRYWAQQIGFISQNLFSCYAFTLMVIFYLQSINPPVLMSVKSLMDKSGCSQLVAGWQAAVTYVLPPKSENHASLEDLLLGFFQFYWNFDFVQNVISIYHGRPLLLKDLKNDPDQRMSDFLVASVNVQDPFILNHNTFKKESSTATLKLSLFTAYQMLQDKTGKFGFSKLFDITAYNKVFRLHFDRFASSKSRTFHIILDHRMINQLHLNLNDPKASMQWYQQSCQAVFDILQYCLLMDCEITDRTTWSGAKPFSPTEIDEILVINLAKVSGAKNSPFGLHLLMCLQCHVFSRVWVGRKESSGVENDSENELGGVSHPILKAEHKLSKALIENNPVLSSPESLLCFRCECYKHGSPQISDIVVMLKPLSASKEFTIVFPFLEAFITRTVKHIMSLPA